ncbi:hypothetical protein ACFLQ3_01105 [Bacteroidota bacterium]
MKKFAKMSLGILIVITIMGCPEELPENDEYIALINNSEEDIVRHTLNHKISNDTSILIELFPWGNDIEKYKIPSKTTYYYGINSESIQYLLNEGWMQFYFLNYDTVLTAPWERIREENIILKKVYFETWEDLEACNFTITYP